MAKIRISSGRSSFVVKGIHSNHVPHGSCRILKLGNGTNFIGNFVSPCIRVKLKLSSQAAELSVVRSRTRYLSHVGAKAPGVHIGRRMKSNETSFPLIGRNSLLR